MFVIESKEGQVIAEAVVIEEGLHLMTITPNAGRLWKIPDEGPPVLMAYAQSVRKSLQSKD